MRTYLTADLYRHGPRLAAQLHRQAAAWWAAQERPVEALRHAAQAARQRPADRPCCTAGRPSSWPAASTPSCSAPSPTVQSGSAALDRRLAAPRVGADPPRERRPSRGAWPTSTGQPGMDGATGRRRPRPFPDGDLRGWPAWTAHAPDRRPCPTTRPWPHSASPDGAPPGSSGSRPMNRSVPRPCSRTWRLLSRWRATSSFGAPRGPVPLPHRHGRRGRRRPPARAWPPRTQPSPRRPGTDGTTRRGRPAPTRSWR